MLLGNSSDFHFSELHVELCVLVWVVYSNFIPFVLQGAVSAGVTSVRQIKLHNARIGSIDHSKEYVPLIYLCLT